MADAILVLNAGSSSVKFSVFVEKDGDLGLVLRHNDHVFLCDTLARRLLVRD